MEVTKKMLESYRSNRQEILELEFMLRNRWKSESMISIDTILNYRKGYPVPEGVAGFDQERYERLQNRDMRRKERLEQECKAVEDFVGNIQNSVTRRIFQLYYTEGEKKPTQAKIAKKIHLDRSRISRKIDDYLKDAHKAQNAHV
ncbi:hypothetical protein H8S76_25475 [Blautia sp. NSJ-34]|uniref:RNA polymerase sigma-70 region 4 domain-containing protein n=2 Tax=Blautia TaxID=572511 RepID=A0ABR7FMD8_9FIRM|nr:hypothetical protein [Blautia celeris]